MNATTCWKETGKTTPHKIRSRSDADHSAQVWFDTPLVTSAHSCERLGPRYLVTSEKWSDVSSVEEVTGMHRFIVFYVSYIYIITNLFNQTNYGFMAITLFNIKLYSWIRFKMIPGHSSGIFFTKFATLIPTLVNHSTRMIIIKIAIMSVCTSYSI